MNFCKIISKVSFAWCPDNFDLVLFDSVSDPVEAHVDGFGTFLFRGVVGDAFG